MQNIIEKCQNYHFHWNLDVLIQYHTELNNSEYTDTFSRLGFIQNICNISSVRSHQTQQ